jgi:NAD(P)H-flavin reductase
MALKASVVLDRVTGRFTMYRLMIIVLGAIAATTVILSLIPNAIAYSTGQLLATLVVCLVATYVSNRLVALVFRVKPHGESSIITALLIFFLFFPTTDSTRLLVLALICAIASASKYLLAIRGRHIFNPAAIAALLIAFAQLSAAVWWVGTPVLLAPVAIGAFVIVYRVRRFALVLTFIAVALIISIVRLSVGGMDVPLGFMLDEPLTMAPLRYQQVTIAVIVAVIMEVPFSVGPLYNSPELALVVGNLIAFLFGQRRSIPLDFVSARQLTPTTREFTFAPARRVSFRPGQYMELSLPHAKPDARGVRRTFSVASAPGAPTVAFGIRVPEVASTFKRSLGELQPGTRLRGTSVGGDFLLPRDTTVPLLLVAGGIGITPFISQLAHITANGEHRDIVVVYAVRDTDELAYASELESAGVPVLVVAPTRPGYLPGGWEYLGSGHLDATQLADRVPRLTSLRRDLRALGLRHVRSDYFSGY